jgi:transcriptional antiterminator NusG
VLQVYSGYENKIEKTIHMLRESGGLDKEVVRDVRVPTEEVTEVKDGQKRTLKKKVLPGYILVELNLPDEPQGWKAVRLKMTAINGVTDFVGTPRNMKPQPIPAEQARGLVQKAGEAKGERPVRSRQTFAVGEQVKIIDGPFESFTGTIEEVNQEKNKLKVAVQIFGRNTPVEVDLLQVEKV